MRIKGVRAYVSSAINTVSTSDVHDETLEFVREHSHPAITAGDIAERFDISQQAANNRLRKLVERGDLARKEVGASAVVYWPSD